ncbi:hypothetical protein TanjilG_04996 [Lupinus angustifolius]|uniref:Uncharacterized protein n=1 Tax=Lupinus angustifolius TaxID=3871 RepID=A0A4P1R5F7_LUPAN|nr:hypothetical protein TanjilG_04996 [Lupinus angustifolius]
MSGIDIAEAYVLRNHYKKKLKNEEGRRTKSGITSSKAKRSSGCFFWISKKHWKADKIKNSEKEYIGMSNQIHKNHMAS